jgi:hypothetical protein
MATPVAASRIAALTGITAGITHISGHTAAPSTTGANEFTGTGASRAAVAWGSATDDGTTATIVGTFTGLAQPNAGATLAWLGGWSALTSGTFKYSWDVTDVTFAGAGSSTGTVTITQT